MPIRATDEDILAVARKYGVLPGRLKCEVFRLLDAGLSRAEIRYLLRGRCKDGDRGTLASTVRTYHHLWLARQSGRTGQGLRVTMMSMRVRIGRRDSYGRTTPTSWWSPSSVTVMEASRIAHRAAVALTLERAGQRRG